MAEISVVLRTAGATLDVDSIIAEHRLAPDLTWKRGESRRRSGIHDTSGMNLFVASAETSQAAISAAEEFLAANRNLVTTLQQSGADVELDFGVMVGSARSFAPSIAFAPNAMAAFAASGVHIVISAYPVST